MDINIEEEFLKFGYKEIHNNIPKTLKAKFRDGKIYSNGYNEYLFISSSMVEGYNIVGNITEKQKIYPHQLEFLCKLKRYELTLDTSKNIYNAIGIILDYLSRLICHTGTQCEYCIFNQSRLCSCLDDIRRGSNAIDTNTYDREMFYDNAKNILSSVDELTKNKFEEMKKRYVNTYCHEQ